MTETDNQEDEMFVMEFGEIEYREPPPLKCVNCGHSFPLNYDGRVCCDDPVIRIKH